MRLGTKRAPRISIRGNAVHCYFASCFET
jgi:hypothetical protein